MPEAAAVREMFSRVAARYDIANHLLSMGLDFSWRRRLVAEVAKTGPRTVVDLATGSGDVALALKRRLGPGVEVTGLDFCAPMLELAEQKAREKTPDEPPTFLLGDCLDLPFPDNSIDALTIAFGLRNLEDRRRGLEEMLRVLKARKGSLFVLEFSQPTVGFRSLYFLYLRWILPRLAALATGQPDAYRYLVNSIEGFPKAESLAAELRGAGFARVSFQRLSLSTVAIHHASSQEISKVS